jgi:hypothetical protein
MANRNLQRVIPLLVCFVGAVSVDLSHLASVVFNRPDWWEIVHLHSALACLVVGCIFNASLVGLLSICLLRRMRDD